MKRTSILLIGIVSVVMILTVAAQDRYTLKAANGVAFSEFRGYETWQSIAPSDSDDGLKMTTGNAVMINAYKEGFPGARKIVPDGAMMAKIEWHKKKNAESPYPVQIPGVLRRVGFMVKDSKRFPETDGWGYAQFVYDAASDTFKPETTDRAFAKQVCHPCHTLVKAKDFVFTAYPAR